MSPWNWREIGFHGRYKFFHSLQNAPGFINFGLRLFNYYLRANSFMQPPDFRDNKRNPTTRTIELPDSRWSILEFLLLLVDNLPEAAFVGTHSADFTCLFQFPQYFLDARFGHLQQIH